MEKYKLISAFHPTAFERGVYAVLFREKGQLGLDRYQKLFQLKARSRKEAIIKAKKLLI